MSSPRISIEKQTSKSKHKILRLIPKAAQASVSFQNPPFSPGRENRSNGVSLKSRLKKTFSGPIMFMIPAEASEKPDNFEPTSPKISCMGQIKHKNKISKQKSKEPKPVPHPRSEPAGVKKVFCGGKRPDDLINMGKPPLPDRAPSISQMRRFASSRDTLAEFDWTRDRMDDGEDDAGITFSAPLMMTAALEPRKEINLWRRRTMAQPEPLKLNIVWAQ